MSLSGELVGLLPDLQGHWDSVCSLFSESDVACGTPILDHDAFHVDVAVRSTFFRNRRRFYSFLCLCVNDFSFDSDDTPDFSVEDAGDSGLPAGEYALTRQALHRYSDALDHWEPVLSFTANAQLDLHFLAQDTDYYFDLI